MAKILVADDDQQVRELLCRVLDMDGHEVWQVADGQAAVNMCRRISPDLAVIDIIMPEKEGLATIRELRQMHPNLRILAISGGGMPGGGAYLQWALRLGADGTMDKPFLPNEFRETVDSLLGLAPPV